MNILNGTEAFTAMSAGQKIECRHVGSDLDFDDIRNFYTNDVRFLKNFDRFD